MSAINQSTVSPSFEGLQGAFKAFAREASALVQALLQPGKILGEVDQMRVLLRQAHAVAATDPQRAERLRARAARIGLN